MKTKYLLFNVILVVGLSGCSSFWENYAKRSDLELGFNSTNDITEGKAGKNLTSTVHLRGSNRDIMKAWQEMTSFARKELGLK